MTARKSKKVEKEKRTTNIYWADGVRATLLEPHIKGYAEAVKRGWSAANAYLKTVYDEYGERIDWRVPDSQEPESVPDYNPTSQTRVYQSLTSDADRKAYVEWLEKKKSVSTSYLVAHSSSRACSTPR